MDRVDAVSSRQVVHPSGIGMAPANLVCVDDLKFLPSHDEGNLRKDY